MHLQSKYTYIIHKIPTIQLGVGARAYALKGYPFRSFAGGQFTNGYSDHFPVYTYVVRRAENQD